MYVAQVSQKTPLGFLHWSPSTSWNEHKLLARGDHLKGTVNQPWFRRYSSFISTSQSRLTLPPHPSPPSCKTS